MSATRTGAVALLVVLGVAYLNTEGTTSTTHSALTTDTAPTSHGDIPQDYLDHYRAAGSTCPNLDWALLAAVGEVETDHGRSPLPGVRSGANDKGARGPMQFLRPTFAEVRGRHPDVGADVYNPAHAIPAAAHYLCDSGIAQGDIRKGLWAYNHSATYGADVRDQAREYRQSND